MVYMCVLADYLIIISKLAKQHLYMNDSVPSFWDPYKRLIAVTLITLSGFHCDVWLLSLFNI